jgi:hypothetical protein
MKGDFSRLRFSQKKNYTSVMQQQGRVSLDSDANEQSAIYDYLRTTETIDVVGIVGGPVHDEGFKISVNGDAIEIGKGRYYVDGILCQNDCERAYADQPFLIEPDPTDEELLSSLQQGTIGAIQVYLQVWKRLVTVLDDCCLREPALGQADTTARVQTIWRVVAKGLNAAPSEQIAGSVALTTGSMTVTGVGSSFTTALEVGEQLVFASDSTETPYTIAAIANDTSLTLVSPYAGASTALAPTTASVVGVAGNCCKSMHTGLVPARGQGKLHADTGGSSGDCSCEPTPAAGYRGLENQLYRVEIQEPGNETSATFKWSRENGSVVVAVSSVSGDTVYVDSLGPDPNLGFASGQWVELSDDTNLFGEVPKPGNLYQIQTVTPEYLSVTLMTPVTSPPDPCKHARMRRWDQFGSSAGLNGISVSAGPISLENGIEVEFSKGKYESGDYWLIPARTATGSIDWPPCDSDGDAFQPPHRTEVFLAPLACITWNTQTDGAQVKDCRKKFYPLTELEPACTSSCCSFSVGDGQNTFGDFTSIQAAVDALPAEGGEICILPGLYYGPVRIVNRRDVVIHGCGWQTRVASASLFQKQPVVPGDALADPGAAINPLAAVFTIVDSQHIKLRSFAVEAADDEAGILIDGTGTSLTKDQAAEVARFLVRLQGVIDVTIEDIVFTASTLPAVLAVRVELLRIDRNRVAMKNVRSMWPAIYASGIEIHIDRNWVGVQSAANDREWLPYTVTEDLGGTTSTSAAAVSPISVAAGAAPASVASSVARDFVLASDDPTPAKETLHPGSIQIGGPSTDVYILENEIEGGNRNGITLGSFEILDVNGNNTGIWSGTVITGETGDCDCDGSLQASGTYPGTTGDTVVAAGKLTNIQIHRNRIRNMGLCGIGPVGFFDLTKTLEIIYIENLTIGSNTIQNTLSRQVAPISITNLGYGAICVPDVQNLIVRDNTITNFGAAPGLEVCGIYILHGEMLDISRNQIIETRDWTEKRAEPLDEAPNSIRGGIVVVLAEPPSFPAPASDYYRDQVSVPIFEPGLPALRVEHNVVRVPLSETLTAVGFGPFSIVNNHFGCGGTVRARGTSVAATVRIVNLGLAIDLLDTNGFLDAYSKTAGGFSVNRLMLSSSGTVVFTNNVCQLERQVGGQRSLANVAIFTLDHLIFSNNQCWVDGPPAEDLGQLSAYIDAFLFGLSVQVLGNRFQEGIGLPVLFSGFTWGLINITAQNFSTYCLLIEGIVVQPPSNATPPSNVSLVSVIAAATGTNDPCAAFNKG